MKLAATIIAALALLCSVIAVRTLLHVPTPPDRIEAVVVDIDADAAARHLSEAIRIRTVSHQRAEDFEAREFEAFIDWARDAYPEVQESMELVRLGEYTMLYRWQGSDPNLQPILVTGHFDVVPVIPGTEEVWRHPPFSGAIVDGVVWGRGALDDKSGVVAQLEAATFLLRSGYTPRRTVYFSFGHDEELGGTQGAAKVAEHLAEQGVRLAWSLDEGSFVFDGILPAIEPLFAVISVAEKGSLTLNIVATAEGGHSSMPPAQTAVGTLAEAITALERNPLPGALDGLSGEMFDVASRDMSFGYRLLFANRWLFGPVIEKQLAALPSTNAMLRTTTAPTMLSGSIKVNVLPVEAVATVNFRLHPRDTIEGVVEHVRSVVETDKVDVRRPAGSGVPASTVSSWDAAGYRNIERAVREIYGEVIVAPGLMIAGSDTRHYGKVADNAYRFNPMTVSPEDLNGFHGTNEKISVENLARGTRTYVRIIRLGSMQ